MASSDIKQAIEAAFEGDLLAVRVTPKAARNNVSVVEGRVRVTVTTVPENGKATRDVIKLLAKALGIAKSDLTLVRGATARDKVFRRAARA
ncbi:DUF167 domain-containing protein [Celeribacter arenosi]|uniref:UPF0235 protein GCM10022404_13360 n=1 Tax=Celeribacter arenosi TaxID=792649 RepID=A0ABP7K5Y1_9RHOB